MSVSPEAVQAALEVLRTAYDEECHLAADAVLTRVRQGEIATDEALWNAIVETHQARINTEPIAPKWAPILLSLYTFDMTVDPVVVGSAKASRESDVLWELNRVAWIYDVCHVLREHHGLAVEGTHRESFLRGNPLDSLSTPNEVTARVVTELETLAAGISNSDTRERILNQARRLKFTHRRMNPSPSAHR